MKANYDDKDLTKVYDVFGYTAISFASFHNKTQAALVLMKFIRDKEQELKMMLTDRSSMTSNDSRAIVVDRSG